MSSKGQRLGLRSGGLRSLWNHFSASQAFSNDVEPIGTTWYLLIFCCRLHSFNPFHAPFRARNEVSETFFWNFLTLCSIDYFSFQWKIYGRVANALSRPTGSWTSSRNGFIERKFYLNQRYPKVLK